jgi:AcrR family transcriptional regulator
MLHSHAAGTQFLKSAEGVFHTRGGPGGPAALRRVADVLDAWVQFVRDGLADMQAFPVRARLEAATDLMEQVQQLLEDPRVHPAAPVVLAGAALEEFLRSRVNAVNAEVSGRPSISTYASALRSSGDLSAQDVKDVTAWAGQRNEAAHGNFDLLSRARAQIMIDGINLFMRQKLANT